jgi:ankyrin repeat protein
MALVKMKWFTSARLWGLDESDPVSSYRRHLAVVEPTLPTDVRDLAFGIELHDARFESASSGDGSVEFCLITDDDRGHHERVHLSYHGAVVVMPSSGELAELHVGAGDTEVLHDEVDVATGGRFAHRGWVWPTGQFAIEFASVELRREPATSAEFEALFHRAHAPQEDCRLLDAWLDFVPPLLAAAARGDVERVREMLAGSVDPDTVDEFGWTALHLSASRSHLDACKALIEAGATVDHPDSEGESPLFRSLQQSDGAVIRYLIEQGANPFGRSGDGGVTAIHEAAVGGNIDALGILLARGAPIDGRDDNGYTPLMTAAESHADPDIAIFLLSRGADPDLITHDDADPAVSNKTATQLAERMGRDRVADVLRNAERANKPRDRSSHEN